ncbi:UDP-GlcNAc--UDP-phosphate GlcNAc-1-phosphate transferase [Pedobacter sp. UYP24]
MSLLIYMLFFGVVYPFFLIGAIIITVVSFTDDIKPISNKIRLTFHLIAVGLLFYQAGVFNFTIYVVILSLIVAIGIINAINFMDGINGITVIYAFTCLITLWYIDIYLSNFIIENLLITVLLAVLVFAFFNFRTKAKCFAGDVGSVSIAFILVFLLTKLILTSGNPVFLLLLITYGLDTLTTILFRLIRSENIFVAHRSHFYQYLSNEIKIPHLYVASGYAFTQLIVNLLVIFFLKDSLLLALYFAVAWGLIFVGLRFYIEGKTRLLG